MRFDRLTRDDTKYHTIRFDHLTRDDTNRSTMRADPLTRDHTQYETIRFDHLPSVKDDSVSEGDDPNYLDVFDDTTEYSTEVT